MCAVAISMRYAAARFLFLLHMESFVRSCGSVHVFDKPLDKFTSCYCDRGLSCADVFFSVVFFRWVCISSCLLCFVVALCSHGLSLFVLICNLRTDFSGQGAAGLCVVVDGLLSRSNFHF
jgi:hypothetical protein